MAERQQVRRQQHRDEAVGERAQRARGEQQPDHLAPKQKSSNAVTLSAFVHTPTAPAP